jgi:hypothetical protein
MDIKIVRLKDSLDIICEYEIVPGTNELEVKLTNPMLFEIRHTNLALQHWLPLAIMTSNSVNIKTENILCTFEANEDFKEYYLNTVEDMEISIKKNINNTDKEEMMEAIAELEFQSAKGILLQ